MVRQKIKNRKIFLQLRRRAPGGRRAFGKDLDKREKQHAAQGNRQNGVKGEFPAGAEETGVFQPLYERRLFGKRVDRLKRVGQRVPGKIIREKVEHGKHADHVRHVIIHE